MNKVFKTTGTAELLGGDRHVQSLGHTNEVVVVVVVVVGFLI